MDGLASESLPQKECEAAPPTPSPPHKKDSAAPLGNFASFALDYQPCADQGSLEPADPSGYTVRVSKNRTTYIQFAGPGGSRKPLPTYVRAIFRFLNPIIPYANANLDNVWSRVRIWKVEIDVESGEPQRELALDERGGVLFAAPTDANYGFWLDTNMKLQDFRHQLRATEIPRESFIEDWCRSSAGADQQLVGLLKKAELKGTAYWEFAIGKTDQHWQPSSVFLTDETFESMETCFTSIPNFDPYGSTYVNQEALLEVTARLRAFNTPVSRQLSDWLKQHGSDGVTVQGL